eukprot:TRINITY_DN10194_c0_g1_i2.p1 TRINITY_DN10194_c0_g1~~TRINITY_DN10194_c0_g1_i2.p1  ORF type:complete len:342 (+),score=52.52 TRINITY_DN10194_c0_g1_i2:126-1151(+)
MGNASTVVADVFSGITEQGNVWNEDGIKPSTLLAALPLPSDYSDIDVSSPSLLVAPTVDQCRSRRPVDVSRCRQDCCAAVEEVITPNQTVLEPTLAACARDPALASWRLQGLSYSWRSVENCQGLRGTLVLTEARLRALRSHLPVMNKVASCWRLLYSPRVHGVSLRTFYRQCQAFPGETLVVAEDANGAVFGGYASRTWHHAHQPYFGEAECFVFDFGGRVTDDSGLRVYPWSGGDNRFMHADARGFAMGGGARQRASFGAGAFAFWIGEDLLWGTSAASETFGNTEPLASSSEFVLRRLECWSFDRGTAGVDAALIAPQQLQEAASNLAWDLASGSEFR